MTEVIFFSALFPRQNNRKRMNIEKLEVLALENHDIIVVRCEK